MPTMRPAPGLSVLALTALRLLHERPMHPYEMARVIQKRRIDVVLALKRGSLYHAVERLAREGLIEAVETSREGRRPERTVYRLTDAGRDEFEARLRELLSVFVYAPTRFTAGVQFLTSLRPAEARELLIERTIALQAALASVDSVLSSGLPRPQLLEGEYARALIAAELEWVRGVVDDLEAGRLGWDVEGSPVGAGGRVPIGEETA